MHVVTCSAVLNACCGTSAGARSVGISVVRYCVRVLALGGGAVVQVCWRRPLHLLRLRLGRRRTVIGVEAHCACICLDNGMRRRQVATSVRVACLY